MDRFNALGRGAQIMLVAGILLFISLFLPWQDVIEGDVPGGIDQANAWQAINYTADEASEATSISFLGVVLGLLTIATLAWLVVRLLAVNIPLPVSTAMTGALLGVLVALFGILKFLAVLGDDQTIWAWIGVILAVLVAVGAYLQVQEAGGVETLKSEIPAMPASGGASSAAPPPPPPPAAAPPPSEPEAAPPPVEPAPPAEPAEPSYPSEPETPPEREEERRDL